MDVLNWIAALLIAVLLSSGTLLDAFDAWRARMRAQHAEAQAAHQAYLQRRADQADLAHTQATCGPNSGVHTYPNGRRECTTKRGSRSGIYLPPFPVTTGAPS